MLCRGHEVCVRDRIPTDKQHDAYQLPTTRPPITRVEVRSPPTISRSLSPLPPAYMVFVRVCRGIRLRSGRPFYVTIVPRSASWPVALAVSLTCNVDGDRSSGWSPTLRSFPGSWRREPNVHHSRVATEYGNPVIPTSGKRSVSSAVYCNSSRSPISRGSSKSPSRVLDAQVEETRLLGLGSDVDHRCGLLVDPAGTVDWTWSAFLV